MRAKLVNEAIKHLGSRSKKDIVHSLKSLTNMEIYNIWAEAVNNNDKYEGNNSLAYLCYNELSNREHTPVIEWIWNSSWHSNFTDYIKYGRKVNEGIKHLSAKSDEEIIENIKGSHPYYQLYIAMEYGMDDLIEELLDKHEVKGNEEEDPFYMLASFYLTDEEISFKHSGSWKFENGEIICYSYDEDTDEICTDMKEYMQKHNIAYKLIRTFSNRTAYVEFSGNASDIIKFVLQFFVFTYETRADIVLDDAYQIIFTG